MVETVTDGTTVTFRSALHQVSNVVGPEDLIFTGGYIHVVDSVMVPPINALGTIAAYPITYYLEGISPLLTPTLQATFINLTNTPDQTYFIPNSKVLAENILNHVQNFTLAETLDLTEYATVPGEIVYSTNLTNGSTWKTVYGLDLTVTEIDGDIFINNAKIINSDLLVANGVIQVIDTVLNASDPNARPQMINTIVPPANNATSGGNDISPSTKNRLSTGAQAGIGVAVAITVLSVFVITIVFFRKRRVQDVDDRDSIKEEEEEMRDHNIYEKGNTDITRHEMPAKSNEAVELETEINAQELDVTAESVKDSNATKEENKSEMREDKP